MQRPWSALLLTLPFLSVPAAAAVPGAPGVPLLYRSSPTDDGATPYALVAHGGLDDAVPARLADTALGVTPVTFARLDDEPARFAYLGFTFTAGEPYAVLVRADAAIASVRVTVNGQDLTPIGGADGAFGMPVTPAGTQSVVIRLERGDARPQGSASVSLAAFSPCPTLQPVLCGDVRATSPRGLTYDMGVRPRDDSGRADLLIPAIVRADGLHGPVRSDVTFLNRFDSPLRIRLSLRSPESGASPERAIELPARSQVRLTDVVRHLLPEASEGQGVLEIRGFATASPGDVSAETYYDNGESGRVGASLPVFAGDVLRSAAPVTILAASAVDDPRLLVFSSDPSAREVTGRILVTAGDRSFQLPLGVTPDRPLSARLSDLFGGELPEGALVTVEGSDPALHAVLVRSDPITGSPRLVSSN